MYIDKISISYLHENIFIKAERGRTTGKWQAFVWVTCHYSPIYLNLRLGLVAWSHKSRRTDCYKPKLRFIYFLLQLSSSRKSTELLAYTICNFYTGEWDVTPDVALKGDSQIRKFHFFSWYILCLLFLFSTIDIELATSSFIIEFITTFHATSCQVQMSDGKR